MSKRFTENLRSSGQCRILRFTIVPIRGRRLENHVIQTIEIINVDVCQLQCYLEPNCVSYNFNKKEGANGQHKCDLNNATYEHRDSDLTKNENYVYRGAEVNIQPVKVFNLPTRPFLLFLFCEDFFWPGFTNCEAARGLGRSELSNLSVNLPSWISNKDPGDEVAKLLCTQIQLRFKNPSRKLFRTLCCWRPSN